MLKATIYISEKLSNPVFASKKNVVIAVQIKDKLLFMLSNMFYGLKYW